MSADDPQPPAAAQPPPPPRRTLAGPGAAVHGAKRSRFYAYARPLSASRAPAAEALQAWLAEIRVRHRDARHLVFAWRDGGGEGRATDDGEPHGTGGRPCLHALTRVGAASAAVAVARIFGGIPLGPAGLARAYAQAAEGSVTAAGWRDLVALCRFEARVDPGDAPAAERVLRALGTEVMGRAYGAETVVFRGHLAPGSAPRLLPELAAATGGRAQAEVAGEPDWR